MKKRQIVKKNNQKAKAILSNFKDYKVIDHAPTYFWTEFSIKELPDFRLGFSTDVEDKLQFWCENEFLIDKFKPSHATFTSDSLKDFLLLIRDLKKGEPKEYFKKAKESKDHHLKEVAKARKMVNQIQTCLPTKDKFFIEVTSSVFPAIELRIWINTPKRSKLTQKEIYDYYEQLTVKVKEMNLPAEIWVGGNWLQYNFEGAGERTSDL